MKQEIQRVDNLRKTVEVQQQTNIQVAERKANATLLEAGGAAQQTLQQAYATANNTARNIKTETQAYKAVKDNIGISNNSDLLNYLWWDLVGGSGGINGMNGAQPVTEVLVGVGGVTPTIAAAPAVAGR